MLLNSTEASQYLAACETERRSWRDRKCGFALPWGRNTTNSSITIPKPQRMIAVVSLVIIESSTTLHAEAALGDHLLQQNARPLGQAGPVLGIIVFDA